MKERMIHLRVKVRSLAAESLIIRQEARKTREMIKWGLNQHRKTIVRYHSRINLLAYGLLRGTPYNIIEKKCRITPDFQAVSTIAKRFGGTDVEISTWVSEATAYIKAMAQHEAA